MRINKQCSCCKRVFRVIPSKAIVHIDMDELKGLWMWNCSCYSTMCYEMDRESFYEAFDEQVFKQLQRKVA